MRDRKFWVLIYAVLIGLQACSQTGQLGHAQTADVTPVALTTVQNQVIITAVKKMLSTQDGIDITNLIAFTLAQQSGVQVCGYISGKRTASTNPSDMRFYIELQEADGPPIAARGQIGTTDAKRAKVIFMCRHATS